MKAIKNVNPNSQPKRSSIACYPAVFNIVSNSAPLACQECCSRSLVLARAKSTPTPTSSDKAISNNASISKEDSFQGTSA